MPWTFVHAMLMVVLAVLPGHVVSVVLSQRVKSVVWQMATLCSVAAALGILGVEVQLFTMPLASRKKLRAKHAFSEVAVRITFSNK